jgi:glycosyltransferase involved in cell wall biosynthesis
MRIAYLTAGAAGMYCGSCMHDNALAKALMDRGHECLLLPVYTPIRTDETSVSAEDVFFGGINIYLQQKMPVLGRLPRSLLKLLDSPWLLKMATRRAGATSPKLLGDLTISMLRGTHGHQASEVKRLVRWLADELKPDVVIMTNLLIGGCIPAIREAMDAKVFVWLQGDDIFIDHLPPKHRVEATQLMIEIGKQIDGCLVNSRFYGDKMGQMLEVPEDKRLVLPLAIQTGPYDREFADAGQRKKGPLRIGYFARLAPEKGLHQLADGFIELSRQVGIGEIELHYAGWLGEHNRAYFQQVQKTLNDAKLGAHHFHRGSPDLQEKVELLREFDLFSVPTEYEDPKGLFVLESLISRVPVVQPNHGSFPELLASTGGGLLSEPGNPASLAHCLRLLIEDDALRGQLSIEGHDGVRARHTIEYQAEQLDKLLME